MSKFYPVSVLLALALFAVAISMAGGVFGMFISIPSLVVVLVTSFVLSLASSNPAQLGRHFAIGFRSGPQDTADLKRALAYFDALGRYLIVSGLVGTTIGAISILGTLNDVETIGRGTALALTTLFYGVLLWMLIVVPFRTGLRNKLAEVAVDRTHCGQAEAES